jgi:hypothetical protein
MDTATGIDAFGINSLAQHADRFVKVGVGQRGPARKRPGPKQAETSPKRETFSKMLASHEAMGSAPLARVEAL